MTALRPLPGPGTDLGHAGELSGQEPAEASDERGALGLLRRLPYLAVLVLASVLFLYPFAWLASASLKPRTEVFDNSLLPHHWRWANYSDVWDYAPVLQWIANSVIVAAAAAVTVSLSSALVAFGFAYFRFPLRNLLFGLVLSTMMLPGAATMIPVYLIWHHVGLTGTQVPLWAQNLFGSAFYIFLLRQFFLGVPREYFEAARVDGCSFFGLFWRIALPLARPALVVVLVFEIQASWTDLLKPLIYLQDPNLFTLPRGLKAVIDTFGNGGEQHWEIIMAASLISTVPLIVLFAFAQKHIMDGIASQGRKG
jgi:multiple sugar transport system permease protein